MLFGCVDLASNEGKDKQAYLNAISKSKAQIYTMRGGLGGLFSKGMNRLQNTLKQDKNLYVSSTIWYKAYNLSQFIIHNAKTGKTHGPIILVGHSLGANEQIKVAKNLARANIPVALLITVDAVSPLPVPPNVKRVLNIYKPSAVPIFRGFEVKALDPSKTKIENLNVDNLHDIKVNHFNIDSHAQLQKKMLNDIESTWKAHEKQ